MFFRHSLLYEALKIPPNLVMFTTCFLCKVRSFDKVECLCPFCPLMRKQTVQSLYTCKQTVGCLLHRLLVFSPEPWLTQAFFVLCRGKATRTNGCRHPLLDVFFSTCTVIGFKSVVDS